jgi:hypothetical protein
MSEKIAIYMPLRNEGTDVWRPVWAERDVDGSYKVLGPMDESEEWEFTPGSVVRCRIRVLTGGSVLVAYELVSN